MKLRRLFWKIFAAFWLASLSIMFATSYVILTTVETEKYRNIYEKTLKDFTERVINHYERIPDEKPLKKSLLRRFAGGPHGGVSQRQIIRIAKGDALIFQREMGRKRDIKTFKFTITSDQGNRYIVEALEPRPPRLLTDTLKRINTLQFFVILFASTLVSFLLSWSITRPLKKLGAASRQFALGDMHTAIDKRLLRRADELGDLAQDFAFMMQQTQQTLSAQKQLLHDVSHELRAPLTRLQVAAELIQQRDEKSRSHIQRIHNECERMDTLIQRILSFARLQESADFTDVDLVQLMQHHIDNIRFEYPRRELRFTHAMPELIVASDPHLLGEAVDNILRNACKYTPDPTPIDIALTQTHQQLVIEIRDFGEGVPAEDLARLTTPFYRSGNRMHGDGFGLGLSIARRAVEKHGGELLLENHPEGGLRVLLVLPGNTKNAA